MDFFKEKISGNKIRFKEDGYNLDLTYITPRIIAMAYPATGLQKIFRNSIDEVSEVLMKRHNNNYITINLSGRKIDQKKLLNVRKYVWEDHKVPNFEVLFQICAEITKFLIEDPERIAVIHCNHGKGRTGTIISCLLIYAGLVDNFSDAMNLYQKKRFQEGNVGVSQPCQIKYIQDFAAFYKNPKYKPQIVCLKSVRFIGPHKLSQPYIKVKHVNDTRTLLSTKALKGVTYIQTQGQLQFKISDEVPLVGDIFIEIKNNFTIGNKQIGNYTFNTMFLQNKTLDIPLSQLSPESLSKEDYFGVKFILQLRFKQFCYCPPSMPLKHRCEKCKHLFIEEENKIENIRKIVQYRKETLKEVNSKELLYGLQRRTV